MAGSCDVIVIGGGVMGLSPAYYLTREGKSVLLLEKDGIGSGASGACDDMILLQSKKPGILLQLTFASLELYRGLSAELEADLEFETRGGMVLIEDQQQLEVMEEYVAKQRSYGLDVKIVGREELHRRQPLVSPHVIAATYSPDDSQVNPLNLMRAFLYKGLRQSLKVVKSGVVALDSTKGVWQAVTADGKKFSAPVVVNAAGTWAGEVAELAGIDIPIKLKKGQIAVTEPLPPLGETNIWSADYIVVKLRPDLAAKREKSAADLGLGLAFSQTAKGNYLLGGTREFVGFDTETTLVGIREIIRQATRFFPVFNNAHIIRTFAGLRPATPDGLPFIGEVRDRPGFFMLAGHEGDGIALAAVSGKIMSQMICGQSLLQEVGELSPDRLIRGDIPLSGAYDRYGDEGNDGLDTN